MEVRIEKIEQSVALLSETINVGFQKIDDNFQLLNKKIDLLQGDAISTNKKIDSLQGKSVSTMETLETGINDIRTELGAGINDIKDIKSEIQKISVTTRYEQDYLYLKDEPKAEDLPLN